MFEWTNECQIAFEGLQNRLVMAPILAFPIHNWHITLNTDASKTGLGTVLPQIQEDRTERVIVYACRMLTRLEHIYCVIRHKLLPVITFIQHVEL